MGVFATKKIDKIFIAVNKFKMNLNKQKYYDNRTNYYKENTGYKEAPKRRDVKNFIKAFKINV